MLEPAKNLADTIEPKAETGTDKALSAKPKSSLKGVIRILLVLALCFLTFTTDIRPFSLFAFPESIIYSLNNDAYGGATYTIENNKITRDESKVLSATLMRNPRLLLYNMRSNTFEPISWTEAQNFTVSDARQKQPSPSGYKLERGVQTFLECGPLGLGCWTHGPSHTDVVKWGIIRRRLGGFYNGEYSQPFAWVIAPSKSEQAKATEKYKQRVNENMLDELKRQLPERYKDFMSAKAVTQLTLEEARLHGVPPIDYVRMFDLNALQMMLNRSKPVAQLAALKNLWGGGETEDTLDPITGKEYEYVLRYDEKRDAFVYTLCANLDSRGKYCVHN